MTAPYEIRTGDALRLLSEMGRHEVDAVITDCPYSSGGATRGDRTAAPSSKYVQGDSSNKELPEFDGDARDQRSWALWCSIWYGEALRVTKPGGILLSFTDWRQLPATCDAVQCGG